jgi:hypothetical protein
MQYLRKFLANLADQMAKLTPLTPKLAEKTFKGTATHQHAFDVIKHIVKSSPVLRTIDHDSNETIYLTCDASKDTLGCYLSQGATWEEA